jgi:RNA polymerase sigma-70 factor, ECF subfamily
MVVAMDARLDRVLAEMEWVRRLAGALARDEIAADDVAQEAWLVATEHAPDDERAIRPWLARVVHNLVRMRHRGASRREARELASATPADHPTPRELLERVEAQRAIAEEVIALAEPYRETVLLHYVEGVPTNAIARRLDVPPGTVRRRLKVARDQLRERLRKGDRVALVLLLAVARSRSARAAPLALGALTMKKTLAGLAALIALLLFGRAMMHRHAAYVAEAAHAAPAHATGANVAGASPLTPRSAAIAFASRHVAGRVIADGQPVAGAIVRLGAMAFSGSPESVAIASTDAYGNFDLGVHAFASAMISAEATERAVAWLRVDTAPAPDRLVLELGACATRVFGFVRDAVGAPIAGARIMTDGLGGFESGRDGSYVACMPPGSLRVSAEGYGTEIIGVTVRGRVRHDITLVPEGVIAGSVTDQAGHAIAGAHVAAFLGGADRGASDGWTTSDAEGHFRIARLAPAHYRVFATLGALGTRGQIIVAVETGGATHELHLVLSNRARLVGKLVANGAPVAGARLTIGNRDDTEAYAQSAADGSFVLDGVQFGTIVLAIAPYRVIAPKKLVVDRLDSAPVTIEVARVGLLHGRVTSHGEPVVDADVTCGASHAFSDASGGYAFDELGDDYCELAATAGGRSSVAIHIAFTTEPQNVDLDLGAAATIHGTVVDAAGAPVADAFVVARQPSHPGDQCTASTGSAGEFTCAGLQGGDYELAASPGPGTRAFAAKTQTDPIRVDAGADVNVNVAVDGELLAIHGTVVDDTGAPIADALVETFSSSAAINEPLGPLPSTRADASGAFVLDRLSAGTYGVRAHAGDGGEVTMPGVSAGATGIELRIERAGSIAGSLVGFATSPDVTFHRITMGGGMSGNAVIDGASFTVTGLEPGPYRLEAYDYANGVEADAATVTIEAGATAHVTMSERARGSVDATVLDATTRTPVAGLGCHVAAVSDGNIGCCGWLFDGPASLSDTTGHVHLDSPAGAVRVFCMPSERPPFPREQPYSWSTGDTTVPAGGTGYTEVLAVARVYPRSDVGFYVSNFSSPSTIVTIDPAGPAASSGLVVGDAITSIDGMPVTTMSPNAVLTLATNHRPGSTLAVGTPRGTFAIVVGSTALQ